MILFIALVFSQRLSTAVRNVSKGILKEHPLLVVHCMTCSGRVIGFYTAGFKSLFRSLDVQVPFTEATLLVGGSVRDIFLFSFFLFSF